MAAVAAVVEAPNPFLACQIGAAGPVAWAKMEHGDVLRPVDIRLVWDRLVKPGIEQIRKDGGHTDWRPEDVYYECRAGIALLLVNNDGFVILQTSTNQYTLEREALIWMAWSKAQDYQERTLPQVEAIARAAGATLLRALSHRRGLERTGWTPDTIVYKRAL